MESDISPSGYGELISDIELSHKQPGDKNLQESVLRRCIKYLNDNADRNMFSDKYMYPITVHALILFSFTDNEVLKWLKNKISSNLVDEASVFYFYKGLGTLKEKFLIERNLAVKSVNQFSNMVIDWSCSRIKETLQSFLSSVQEDENLRPSKRVSNAITECLMYPDIMRRQEEVKRLLVDTLRYLKSINNFPSTPNLLPSTIYFMFEGDQEQKSWAEDWLTGVKTSKNMCKADELNCMILSEFNTHFYRIQDANYFSIETCILFWKNFLKLFEILEKDAFTKKLNIPIDIEVMSKHRNIRFYPLIRVFFNTIMAYLEQPLPILLAVLNQFLKRLRNEFWSLAAPYSFFNILDTVLGNPHFKKYLFFPVDHEYYSEYSFQDTRSMCMEWMQNFPESLFESQKQTSIIKISTFLFKISSSEILSTESEQASKIQGLFTLSCKLLSNCFGIVDNGGDLGNKTLPVELLKKRDARVVIENESSVLTGTLFNNTLKSSPVSKEVSGLLVRVLFYDTTCLAYNSICLLQNKLPTSFDIFPLTWKKLSKMAIHANVELGLDIIKSLTNICSIIKIDTRKNDSSLGKDLLEARSKHNSNVGLIIDYWAAILEKLGLADSETLRDMFSRDPAVSVGFWSSFFSPYVNQSALDVIYQVFDVGVGGRYESIQALVSSHFSLSIRGIISNLKVLTKLSAFEPCPKTVRILMDIIKVLSEPLNGFLITKELSESQRGILEDLWNACWYFLIMVYQKTLQWASLFHLSDLLEFTRDTLDFSHILLDSFRIINSSISTSTSDRSHSLFQVFMNTFNYAIVWLRLGDMSLLNSCVDLVFKGLDLAKELDFAIEKEFVATFAKYGAKAKKFNNKLTEAQRLQILSKAREFDEETVECILQEVQENKTKTKPALESHKTIKNEDTINEPATFKYQTAIRQPKQQTLTRFGVVTSEPPVAPAPPQKEYKSASLEAIRKELKGSRIPAPKPSVPSAPPAAARPAGFNRKSVPVGRSLQQLKKRRDSDSSESETNEDDVDVSDLFVEKKKLKPKVVELGFNGKPVVRSSAIKKNNEKRAEEYMKLRLNVNLKPLYSNILKWNFNSTSNFPTDEREQYTAIKDAYSDVKEYTKITEPLLMLECWQGIQSSKQTSQDLAFDLLIGSRTSCDGFFDVYASMKKSTVSDRKLTDSDLLVLGSLEGKQFSDDKRKAEYILSNETLTCLAKVREIKSANSEYCDITIRVYPSGPMMGILTPKNMVIGLKVMQMTTIEREYSSLKGLPYYDLCENILESKPNAPLQITDEEAKFMLEKFNVNRSQASAILGTYKQDGFSLIQGPPGTGKTKTILGIVGYALAKSQNNSISVPTNTQGSNKQVNNSKLLICAPSNAAVDELVLRLRQGVKSSSGESMNLSVVRLGRSDAINSSVRDLTLEELVDKQLQSQATNTMSDPTIRTEHTKCVSERNRLRELLQQPNLTEEEVTKYEDELRAVNRKRNELAKRLDEQRERVSIAFRTREIERRQLQSKILSEANVICSTLSGSAHDFLASMNMVFDQVIIDEACQCVELSALIPLRYGCKKCIMVGDPNQLPPTVLSQVASSFNYEQSLFVRMQKKYPSHVYLLDIQYRMHPDISRFPSAEFYNSRLHDGEGMKELNQREWHSDFPLSPYRFFNITGKHKQSEYTRSLYNYSEAQVALEMVKTLMKILPQNEFSGRIGIISPYKEQIRVLKDVFRKNYGQTILNEIDFNTVDGFQGQEKEIIIMSCVRASDSGNVGFLSDVRRMNVALTRARTTLWILGNKESLSRNKTWNHLLEDAKERDAVTDAYPGFLARVYKNANYAANNSELKRKQTERDNDRKRLKSQETKPQNSTETQGAKSSEKQDNTMPDTSHEINKKMPLNMEPQEKKSSDQKSSREPEDSKAYKPTSSGIIPRPPNSKPKPSKKNYSIFIQNKRNKH
ncbi:Piso0_003026 [Millerozyma farinosa CBS 7064]|uniref:Piso0_003026 protein n=1 Tax=Pichia sorbitophila (strain ATCC MYA-4447 / BCRC 22081 / CBS 7064 / NBRC 10061 / NRRL Y-12695) TaxID=559304 RepID=G8YGZ6_PICSO|nr:Piso0_003026 [Millerozyma farinosa CBS 7064]CCE80698.1 Piso0_003026 [Millerozyma farinosa CBS 7064]